MTLFSITLSIVLLILTRIYFENENKFGIFLKRQDADTTQPVLPQFTSVAEMRSFSMLLRIRKSIENERISATEVN